MLKFDFRSRGIAFALVTATVAVALAACGGGGGSGGTPVVGPGTGASSPSGAASAVAADLVVVLNKNTMTNSGSDSITATVTSIDANRAAVAGVPVTFTANAGAIVTPSGTSTDSKGTLTATVTQGSDTSVRPVTLTVTSGTISRPVSFDVVQNSSPADPKAARLTLSLNSFSIDNSGSRTVIATATAIDGNQNALKGIPVQLSVTDGPPLAAGSPSSFVIASSTQTNDSGQVVGTVNIGKDHSNRAVTVTATSGALSNTAVFQVTGTKFAQASPLPAVVIAGAQGVVQYTLADVNGNPMANIPITVTGAGVTSKSGATDENGDYSFDYTSPNAPGTNLALKAVAGGSESNVTVPIASGGNTTQVPIATAPVAKTLNLSADVVSVNTDQSKNQIGITAFFRDAANAPVPNVRVLFGVTGDNQTGSVGSGQNTVLSDASGSATTTYRPGAVSSPTNGVTVKACWKISDFVAGETVNNCPAGQLLTTTLTIVANPVSISIGTDNTISTATGGLTYIKKFVVLVVDSAGNPKADVQITPSVDLGGYGKGYWTYNAGPKKWERAPGFGTLGALTATCPNEDLNRNGVIDSGEDINGNKQLDPRKSDVNISVVGSTQTDASGTAVLQLQYPANIASWVKYKITVTAAGVLSPPAYYPLGLPVSLPSQPLSALVSASDYLYTYDWLPVLADAVGSDAPPPFANSLYGVSGSCTDAK